MTDKPDYKVIADEFQKKHGLTRTVREAIEVELRNAFAAGEESAKVALDPIPPNPG